MCKRCDWLKCRNESAALRVASVLMRKNSELFSIVSKDITPTITQHWKFQDDPYRYFSVCPMRLELSDKDTASSVASNRSLLLRHIHPVYPSFTIPRNQILFSTSRIVEARG